MRLQTEDLELESWSDDGVNVFSVGGGGGGSAPAVTLSTAYSSSQSTKTEQYIIRAQTFDISANGLKPLTRHFFYYEGGDASDRCKPSGGNIGDSLVTDASGSLSFTVFVDTTTIVPTTGFEQAEALVKNFAITKQVRIASASGDSYCDSSIGVVTTQEVTTITPDAIIKVVETPYVEPVVTTVVVSGGRDPNNHR